MSPREIDKCVPDRSIGALQRPGSREGGRASTASESQTHYLPNRLAQNRRSGIVSPQLLTPLFMSAAWNI